MRGKRDFTKHITHMPSGRWTWNVLDTFGNHLAGGLARSYRDGRKKAMEAERAIAGAARPEIKTIGAVNSAFSFRNQVKCKHSPNSYPNYLLSKMKFPNDATYPQH